MFRSLRQRRWRNTLVAASVVASAIALSACSGSDSGSSTGSASAGKHTYKIGVFIPATSNAYLQAEAASAKSAGKELGADVTVIASNWDAQSQNAAFKLAQQRKTYDAWVVNAISPSDQCGTIKQAARSGIPVIIAVTAICGDDGYTSGTVGFVGEQNAAGYTKWFNYLFKNVKPGPVSILTGPALDFVTETTTATAKKGFAAHPDFSIASLQNTDYSTSQAYSDTQTFLKSNANLSAIASNYSGMTRGVVQAVQQAGDVGKVTILDSNGDSWTKKQIQNGTITAALPGMPKTDIRLALQLLIDSLNGKKVATNTNPLDTLKFAGAPIITKDNVSNWNAEY